MGDILFGFSLMVGFALGVADSIFLALSIFGVMDEQCGGGHWFMIAGWVQVFIWGVFFVSLMHSARLF